MTETGPATVGGDGRALEVVQHLPGGRVHEADVRVERRREIRLAVLRGHHRSYGILG